jgi:hypothetical protein
MTNSIDLPPTATRTGWLSDEEMSAVRAHLPVVYVEAVPVRVDAAGQIVSVGLLLAPTPDGSISRTLVSGRVLYGERIREALLRHVEKDLGPLALPRVPVSPSPFTVAEYFPDPTTSGFHDPRQHAVALAFVVPVDGECRPSQSALDLAWVEPSDAVSDGVAAEMSGGRDRLVRMALAFGGCLP